MQQHNLSETKLLLLERDERHESSKENDLWIQSQRWNRFKLLKQRAGNELQVFLPSLCASHDPENAVGRFAQHRLFESKLISLVNVFVGPKSSVLNLDFLPFDVAFDEMREELFVLSKSDIHVYDLNGKLLRVFDKEYNDLPLDRPRGIYVNSHLGWLCVSDSGNLRVLILNVTDGSLVRSIGSVYQPSGVTMHQWKHTPTCTPSANVSDYRIFVCDAMKNCVQVFMADDGAFLFQFPGIRDQFVLNGLGAGQLDTPWSVAINSERDEVYVAEAGNHRVSVFSIDGKFCRHIGSKGSVKGQFFCPRGIVVHPVTFSIMVIDGGNHRLQVFDREGRFVRYFGTEGHLNNRFYYPAGLCVHSLSRHIAVADTHNKRLQIMTMI